MAAANVGETVARSLVSMVQVPAVVIVLTVVELQAMVTVTVEWDVALTMVEVVAVKAKALVSAWVETWGRRRQCDSLCRPCHQATSNIADTNRVSLQHQSRTTRSSRICEPVQG